MTHRDDDVTGITIVDTNHHLIAAGLGVGGFGGIGRRLFRCFCGSAVWEI